MAYGTSAAYQEYLPPLTSTPKRIAIYARVSTVMQAEDGYSIDAQIAHIREMFKLQGDIVVEIYADRGITGTSIEKRLELQRMLRDAESGHFDTVMVWKISRLGRNLKDILNIVDVLERNNISFISISEKHDTSTPTGKMMLSMMGIVAEVERENIISNLKLGMAQRAKEGYKNGGKMLGYRSEGSGKNSRLVIVPEEAELVKMIYDQYLQGDGYKAIANRINKMGYKTVKGNLFAVTQISSILENPTYAGYIRFNQHVDWEKKRRKGVNKDPIKVEGRHEGIISRDIWEQVQAIKEKRSALKQRGPRNGKFPLTGLLRCPECGSGMVCGGTTNTRKDGTRVRTNYYVCGSFSNKGSAACHANSVRAEDANAYVFQRLKEVFTDDILIKKLVDTYNSDSGAVAKLEKRRESIDKKRAEYNQRRNRIFELYEENLIDREMLSQRLLKIDEERNGLDEELAEIDDRLRQQRITKVPYKQVNEAMNNFHTLFEHAEPAKKKMLLELVISKITVGEDRKVESINIQFTHEVGKIISKSLSVESSEEGSTFYVFEIEL